jgi:hypothetical protein
MQLNAMNDATATTSDVQEQAAAPAEVPPVCLVLFDDDYLYSLS